MKVTKILFTIWISSHTSIAQTPYSLLMQPVRVQVRASQLLRGPVHRQTQVKQRLNEVIHGLWSKKKKAFREKELIVNSLNQYSEKLDDTKISMSATLLLESYINEGRINDNLLFFSVRAKWAKTASPVNHNHIFCHNQRFPRKVGG